MRLFQWLGQDARYAVRSLARDRGVALTSVFTLALGIGAATVIFSVVDNVLLEPFPYKETDRDIELHVMDRSAPNDLFGRAEYRMSEFRAIRDENHVFDDVIGIERHDVLSVDAQGARQFNAARVTPNTFDFLGARPLLGRGFVAGDAAPGAPPVMVMSHRLWARDFGADPSLVGKTLTIDGEGRTLVGVMPPRFLFWAADIWLPLGMEERPATAGPSVWPLGHLKPGISPAAATADLQVIVTRLAALHPDDYPKQFFVRTITLLDGVVGRFRSTLYTLMAAVGLLLLIACSNVANLLLARGTARGKELAVRASLGATRGRLVAQLLVEGLVLAAAGGVLGCGLAWAALKGLIAAVPADTIPIETVIGLNPTVLLFSVAVAVATTLLCALAPALQGTRGALHPALKDGNKGAGGATGHGRLRSGLVVTEVALSIVLLVGAGLMMRSVIALQRVPLALEPARVFGAGLVLPEGRYQTAAAKGAFFRQALQRVGALPGVESAAACSNLPPFGGIRSAIAIQGQPPTERQDTILQLVTEGYFATAGLRVTRGRLLSEADVVSGRRIAVVNEALVHRYLPSGDPLGQHIRLPGLDTLPDGAHDAALEIVGVTADAQNAGLQEPIQPEAFVPLTLAAANYGIIVKTPVGAAATLAALRREVSAVDPNVALVNPDTVESVLRRFAFAEPRFGFILFSAFAGLGLLLVAVGVFSVMAYAVSLQTRDIGIRMAIGAQRGDVLRMVLGKGLRLIAGGVVLGELLSLALTRVLASQIFGVSATDPLTFAGVVAVLLFVGSTACLIPARRAARVDPMVALRYE